MYTRGLQTDYINARCVRVHVGKMPKGRNLECFLMGTFFSVPFLNSRGGRIERLRPHRQCSGKIYFYGIYLHNNKYISIIIICFSPLRGINNIFLFENRRNIFKIYLKNILYFLLSILGKSAICYTFKMRFRSSI